MHHQVQILRHLGDQLQLDLRGDDLLGQREPQHEGQHDEVDEARPQGEQHRRRQKERQEGVTLAPIKARRDEAIELPGQDREGDRHRPEHRQLHLGEEPLQRRGVLQSEGVGRGLDLVEAGDGQHQVEGAMLAVQLLFGQQGVGQGEGAQQELIELLGIDETDHEADRQRAGADDQPLTQLDQVLHQGRAGGLDLGLVAMQAQLPASGVGAWSGWASGSGLALALRLALGWGAAGGSTSAGSIANGSPSGPT